MKVLEQTFAQNLKERLADIRAATTISDLLVGAPRISEDGETLLVDIGPGFHLVLAANHVNNPRIASGEIDWTKVQRLKVLAIGELDG